MAWFKQKFGPTKAMRLHGAIEEATDLTDRKKQWGFSYSRDENKRHRERKAKLAEVITELTAAVGVDNALDKYEECWLDAKRAYAADLQWIRDAIEAAANPKEANSGK